MDLRSTKLKQTTGRRFGACLAGALILVTAGVALAQINGRRAAQPNSVPSGETRSSAGLPNMSDLAMDTTGVALTGGLDWAALVESRREQISLGAAVWQGGELVLLEDNISDGVAVDMSALAGSGSLSNSVVYNGIVPASHDLGNAYVYVTRDAEGHRILRAAAERLGPSYGVDDSYVDFEFNQGRVQAVAASRPLRGVRIDGDLLVHLSLTAGRIASVEFKRWAAGGFETIETAWPAISESCSGDGGRYVVCSSSPMNGLPSMNQDLYDVSGDPTRVPTPDSFVEVGLNVAALLGSDIEFTSIQVRTPHDIILDSFRSMGEWSVKQATTRETDSRLGAGRRADSPSERRAN